MPRTTPNPNAPIDRAWPGLAIGLSASVLLHLFAVPTVIAAFGSNSDGELDDPLQVIPEPLEKRPNPLRLGLDRPSAAISWLGVREDPVEGIAPESEVDQAALAPTPGAPSDQPPVPDAQPAQPEQVQPQQPAPEPTAIDTEAESAEPLDAPLTPNPQEIATDPDPTPPEPATEQASPDPIPAVEDAPGPVLVAEPALQRAPVELFGPPAPPEPSEQSAPAETPPESEPVPQTQPPAPTPGDVGQQSRRAADAAMRRRATPVDTTDLGRPLAAEGLELITVKPRWPASVRASARPGNAFVVIHFGADGKVKSAEFIREADGTRGTGYVSVDGPLIDAVYQWRAKGAQIDALDPENPADRVSIPMRFLLNTRG